MSLRIACDLDGTLADLDTALQREAEQLFGPDVDVRGCRPAIGDPSCSHPGPGRGGRTARRYATEPGACAATRIEKRALTAAELRRLWAHVRQIPDFWLGLDEIERGAVAQIASFAGAHGWELLFITQRPATAGDTVQRQSQKWLARYGFEYPSVHVTRGSRGTLAKALALHAVVDDRPDNCVDVAADSQAAALLLWRDPPDSLPGVMASLDIRVVYSMTEALEQLAQMTHAKDRPRRLFARLRAAWPRAAGAR